MPEIPAPAPQGLLLCVRHGKAGVRDGTAAGRLCLDIPYANKDEAKKQLGARWGPARRKWYVDAAKVSREQAARWLPSS
ncbi:DUF5710 domain-containing protein [Streptomyces rochei]|uniref:DUF5710 domain-containing protein n=1 Tax=Streptomyces rochei TaxID=1928 RepID=UPI003D92A387